MMTAMKHVFRANLMSDWEKVALENDIITYQKGEQPALTIAISDILSVRIVKNYGGSFTCHIEYADGKVLKVNTGAIERFGSPYQNLESFSLFSQALLVRPNPSFQIYVGSNAMYYFATGSLIVGGLIILFVLFVILNKGASMPAYIEWKMGFVVSMLVLFSWPLSKMGKSRKVEVLDVLPYELAAFVTLEKQEGDGVDQ